MAGIKCDSCDRKQLVKVNVLRKSVNQLRDTRQRFPGDGVNLFRMDHGSHKSQITVICLSLTGVDSHEALNVKFLKSFKLWENKNSVAH